MKSKIALFPGSFDPFTNGHHDLVLRALPLFDTIVIAIGVNSSKSRMFPVHDMLSTIKTVYQQHKKVEVVSYEGLTADFAQKSKANHIIRGLRNARDFNYEAPIAQANNFINSNLETIFLASRPEHSFISSTVVRDLYKNKKDISTLVPYML